MNMEVLEEGLKRLVKSTCNLLVEMDKAPSMINQNDEENIEFWKEHFDLRHSAILWGRSSRELSEACIRAIIGKSDHSATEKPTDELRETWSGGVKQGARSGANVSEVMIKHRPELIRLLKNINDKLSEGRAYLILKRLDRTEGWDDWKFRNTMEHADDPGQLNQERTRADFSEYGYGRITRDRVLEITEQLILIYDAVRGDEPGNTILVRLMGDHHIKQQNPERHSAWFVVNRLQHLIWTRYVSNDNLTGEEGLITAVMDDNLITVVGNGGLGKTALVYEFIKRNYEDRTRTEFAYVEPFERVLLFSTKGSEQGELNTYDGSGGILDPNDGDLSIMGYMPPGSYSEFIDQICSLDRSGSKSFDESREDWALRILMKQNVLVVLDNYEDIERKKSYQEDKMSYENFLNKWAKKLVKGPEGRIIMTSRTGLLQFSRTGQVKMENLGLAGSKELLKQRYIWLFERQGGARLQQCWRRS